MENKSLSSFDEILTRLKSRQTKILYFDESQLTTGVIIVIYEDGLQANINVETLERLRLELPAEFFKFPSSPTL